jgi:hypothetical protein
MLRSRQETWRYLWRNRSLRQEVFQQFSTKYETHVTQIAIWQYVPDTNDTSGDTSQESRNWDLKIPQERIPLSVTGEHTGTCAVSGQNAASEIIVWIQCRPYSDGSIDGRNHHHYLTNQ